jgi:hypothetical protein
MLNSCYEIVLISGPFPPAGLPPKTSAIHIMSYIVGHRRKLLGLGIEMLLLVYDGFIDKCDQSSREYAILKTALFPPTEGRSFRAHSGNQVDMDDADKLFLLACKVYPEALEDII